MKNICFKTPINKASNILGKFKVASIIEDCDFLPLPIGFYWIISDYTNNSDDFPGLRDKPQVAYFDGQEVFGASFGNKGCNVSWIKNIIKPVKDELNKIDLSENEILTANKWLKEYRKL